MAPSEISKFLAARVNPASKNKRIGDFYSIFIAQTKRSCRAGFMIRNLSNIPQKVKVG